MHLFPQSTLLSLHVWGIQYSAENMIRILCRTPKFSLCIFLLSSNLSCKIYLSWLHHTPSFVSSTLGKLQRSNLDHLPYAQAWKTYTGWAGTVVGFTSFASYFPWINVLWLIFNILRIIISYPLSEFLVVSRKRISMFPVPPSWPELNFL